MKKKIKATTNTPVTVILSDEELNKVSHLSSMNCDVKAIAQYLKVNPDNFESESMREGSPIHQAIEKGINQSELSIGQKQFEAAKGGDKESIREFKKDARSAKFDRYKSKLMFDQKVTDFEMLQSAVNQGKSELPEQLQKYYDVLDFIRTLSNKMNSRSYIVSQVRLKWKDISYNSAVKFYYESLNFFNVDNGVKKEAWANIYADQLDIISNLALENKELEIAAKYKVEAAKLRGVGREEHNHIPEELLDRRPILYTFNATDFGIKPVNRRKLAQFIDNLDISEKERGLINRDAMIEDVPFELFPDDTD